MNEVLLAALQNWKAMHKVLTELREDQVKELLDYEMAHAKRASLLERLHQRYNTLRVARERAELLKEGVRI